MKKHLWRILTVVSLLVCLFALATTVQAANNREGYTKLTDSTNIVNGEIIPDSDLTVTHDMKTSSNSGVITKATLVTAPTIAGNLTYTGQDQPLLSNFGEVQNGTLRFVMSRYLTGSDTWTTVYSGVLASELMRKKIGTWRVQYYIEADEGYVSSIPVENMQTCNTGDPAVTTVTIGLASLTNVSVSQIGTLTYTGEPQRAQVSANATTVDGGGVQFFYSLSQNGTYRPVIPAVTDAGTYTVYYRTSASDHKEVRGSFEIKMESAKATLVTAPTIAGNLTYTGQPQSLLANFGEVQNGTLRFNVSLYDTYFGTWTTVYSGVLASELMRTSIGAWRVQYYIEADEGYVSSIPIENMQTCNTGDPDVTTVTIGLASLTNVSVSQIGTLTYTGEPQRAQVSASATALNGLGVEFAYGLKQNMIYMPEPPAITDAGTYTVYYIARASNHKEVWGSFEVKMEPATPTVTWPTLECFVNHMSDETPKTVTQGSASVAGTFAIAADAQLSYSAAGSYTTKMTFTPTDAKNYKTLTNDAVELSVVRREIMGIHSLHGNIDGITYYYGMTLDQLGLYTGITLEAEANRESPKLVTVPLSWSGYNSATLDPQYLEGTYVLDDVSNEYANSSGMYASKKITLSLRTATVPTWDAESTPYTGSPIAYELSAITGVASVTYTYEGINGTDYPASTTAPTDVGEYSVTAVFTMQDGYNTLDNASTTLTITKASVADQPHGDLKIANNLKWDYELDFSALIPTAMHDGTEFYYYYKTYWFLENSGYCGGIGSVSEKTGKMTLNINRVDTDAERKVGEVTVTVKSKNYADFDLTIDLTSTSILTASATVQKNTGLTYTGSAQQLVTASVTGGTIYYQVNGGAWTTEAIAVDAGKYTVAWYIEGDGTFASSGWQNAPIDSVEVTISKKDEWITVSIDDWTYGETPAELHYDLPANAGDPQIKYATTGGGSPRDTAPVIPGEYYAFVRCETANIIYKGQTTFTLHKAVVTITALNRNAILYGIAPDLTNPTEGKDYTVSGLLNGDTLDEDIIVVLSYEDGMSLAYNRNFAIIPSVVGSDRRYDFAFENGVLFVTYLPSPSSLYYTITPTANEGGSISSSSGNTTSYGKSLTFVITPDEGYEVSDVLVDGKSVGAVLSYTFENIRSSHSIEVIFEKKADDPAPVPTEFPFTDVPEDAWFRDDVEFVYEAGLMNGMSADTFCPDDFATRGQIITILYRLAGEPDVSGECSFTDVEPGAYYEKAVIWAARNGLVNGYGDNLFGAKDSLSREQLVTLLYRFVQYLELDVSKWQKYDILDYNDALTISDYAYEAMQWACGAGVMQGDQGYLSPIDYATRAQLAAMLHRFVTAVLSEIPH